MNGNTPNEIVKEEWRPVDGYSGMYEVSNLGNVRSVTRVVGNGRLIKGQQIRQFERAGYLSARLSKNHHGKFYLVHRIVARAFVPNPHNLPIINHKDENKLNNRADNLEWCTHSYNIQYGGCIEKIARSNGSSVVQILKNGERVLWNSMKEAERRTGVRHQDISRACRGIRESAGGFIWKYAN